MGMVSKLMESGALQDMMESLKGSPTSDERVPVDDYRDKDDDGRGDEAKNESAHSMPDIASLMNPEMMKMLPGLLSSLGKGRGDSGKNENNNCQRSLLLALRPFLSENRQRAIDMMISMEKLGVLREILPKER